MLTKEKRLELKICMVYCNQGFFKQFNSLSFLRMFFVVSEKTDDSSVVKEAGNLVLHILGTIQTNCY